MFWYPSMHFTICTHDLYTLTVRQPPRIILSIVPAKKELTQQIREDSTRHWVTSRHDQEIKRKRQVFIDSSTGGHDDATFRSTGFCVFSLRYACVTRNGYISQAHSILNKTVVISEPRKAQPIWLRSTYSDLYPSLRHSETKILYMGSAAR